MKKTILTIMLALVAFAGAAKAQETYLGAQYIKMNVDVHQPNFSFDKDNDMLGGVLAYTKYVNAKSTFGLTAEGSANFNTGQQGNQLYTAMGGVTLMSRGSDKFQPFVKGLAGAGVLHVGDSMYGSGRTDTSPAFKLSTGFDVGKGKTKWRVIEVGLLQTRNFNDTQNNFVLSSGIRF